MQNNAYVDVNLVDYVEQSIVCSQIAKLHWLCSNQQMWIGGHEISRTTSGETTKWARCFCSDLICGWCGEMCQYDYNQLTKRTPSSLVLHSDGGWLRTKLIMLLMKVDTDRRKTV